MNKLDLKAIRKISEERYYNECGFLREYQNNGNKPLDHTDKESLDIEYDWTLGQFKRYLELINKPVETTNEIPNLTKEELDYIKNELSYSFRGYIFPECNINLQDSIKKKLGM